MINFLHGRNKLNLKIIKVKGKKNNKALSVLCFVRREHWIPLLN
jgi:hypothetical protein